MELVSKIDVFKGAGGEERARAFETVGATIRATKALGLIVRKCPCQVYATEVPGPASRRPLLTRPRRVSSQAPRPLTHLGPPCIFSPELTIEYSNPGTFTGLIGKAVQIRRGSGTVSGELPDE